jgi:hypothetical protein
MEQLKKWGMYTGERREGDKCTKGIKERNKKSKR